MSALCQLEIPLDPPCAQTVRPTLRHSDTLSPLPPHVSVLADAGVSSSYVMVAVTAGSVNIYAQITIPNGRTASAIHTQVANTLGDATKASTALGISVTSATVSTTSTTAVSQSIANDNDAVDKSSSSRINIGTIAGGAAGGAVAVAVLGGGAYYIWKQKNAITTTV